MKVPNEKIEQWHSDWYDSHKAGETDFEFIAQRAADWAVSKRDAELLAEDGEIKSEIRALHEQLAAARLQGADEERKKWEWLHEQQEDHERLDLAMSKRITELEAQRDELLTALKSCVTANNFHDRLLATASGEAAIAKVGGS